jgi:DME family drug/metabolite transporter
LKSFPNTTFADSFSGGSLLVLTAAVLWGTTGTALAFAPQGADPAAVGAVRIAVGGAALVGVAALRGEISLSVLGWPLLPTAAAAVGIACYQPLFFGGVARTGVAMGTIVTIGSTPVAAGVIAFLFRGERPGMRWAAATTLAVAGCALLVSGGERLGVDTAGVMLALGAGLSYGTYATATKVLLESRPYTAVMAVAFGIGALLLLPVFAFADLGWMAEPRGLAVAIELGTVATAAAYLLFAKGLAGVSVSSAATLSLAEPLTAGVLGVAVLGERLSAPSLVGAGLLLCGLVLVSIGRERRAARGGKEKWCRIVEPRHDGKRKGAQKWRVCQTVMW